LLRLHGRHHVIHDQLERKGRLAGFYGGFAAQELQPAATGTRRRAGALPAATRREEAAGNTGQGPQGLRTASGGVARSVVEARGVDRQGNIRVFTHADMGFKYRSSAAPADVIFTQALFQGRPGAQDEILAEMDRITAAREAAQPIREKTGGSTFKNPPGQKAWMLIDKIFIRVNFQIILITHYIAMRN
jgi:hypothetical protein